MPQLVEVVLLPHERQNTFLLREKVARQTGLRPDQLSHIEILKSSLDARSRQAVYRLRVEAYGPGEIFTPEPAILDGFKPVDGKRKVIIVGAGPAGYFAALELIEQGKINTNAWISHRCTFDELPTAMPEWIKPATGVVKAVVNLL